MKGKGREWKGRGMVGEEIAAGVSSSSRRRQASEVILI